VSTNSFTDSGESPKDVIQGSTADTKARIAIVTARWNHEVTYKLEDGAIGFLSGLNITPSHRVRVPGAVEIPLAAKALLEIGVEGIIALGCVIRGETTHYETVCNSVERGCTELQILYGKPVTFGVLTVENMAQAMDRVGGIHGHKGREAAEVCLEMISLTRKLQTR
jgi:6,7-dimethyl-8-ribityllumazine synthase